MRVLILGGGPAGLLAGRSLADAGYSVTLADPALGKVEPTARAAHVHLLPEACWCLLERLAPGLQTELASLGVPFGPSRRTSGTGDVGKAARPWPDRAALDEALRNICLPAVSRVVPARPRRLSAGSEGWAVGLDRSGTEDFDLLVDATGASGASFGAAASFAGEPVPLDQGPQGGGYVSATLRGVRQPANQLARRAEGSNGLRALLLRERDERWRLSLQLPPGVRLPRNRAALRAALSSIDDPRLAEALSMATIAGPVVPWPAQAPRLAAVGRMRRAPKHWLLLGDTLLTTPPRQGHGLLQAAQQATRLREGLCERLEPPALRERIARKAEVQWLGATIAAGLTPAGMDYSHRAGSKEKPKE